jgi:hypothetical protein
MSSWNYRIIRRKYETGEIGYEIHEVYYDEGKPWGWTENAKAPYGETPEDLIWCLERMLVDAKKSVDDIIDYEATPEGKGPEVEP